MIPLIEFSSPKSKEANTIQNQINSPLNLLTPSNDFFPQSPTMTIKTCNTSHNKFFESKSTMSLI